MAFIRVKKVKKWEYAYLVENKWKSKTTKQKVKKYLGKVCRLENIVGIKFEKEIDKMGFKDAARELVKFELLKNGFTEEKEGGKEKGVLTKEMFTVNFDKGIFLNNGKPVVFESNEGFICSFTFNRLMRFKPSETEEETGLRLAEAILEAGISIPHNVFVNVFEKVHKVEMPVIGNFEDSQKFINGA